MKIIRKIFFLLVGGSLATSTAFAGSHQFAVLNNSPWPVDVTIQTTAKDWYRSGSITQKGHTDASASFSVIPFSNSNTVSINTGIKHAYSIPERNQGKIRITQGNQSCTVSYQYNSLESSLSYFKKRSLVFGAPGCTGTGTLGDEISVVNDSIKAIPRPLVGDPFINLDKLRAAQLTEALSIQDCGGKANNCLIISPSLTSHYQSGGSTLQEALNLQARINEAEPFGFEQFMGAHNATISREYTHSKNPYNMSHSDPNHFISITEMLNRGIREIEIDTVWYNGKVRLCHNHNTSVVNAITCSDNISLTGSDSSQRYPFTEIQQWANSHPDELVMLYFDINQSLDKHISAFNEALKTLSADTYTPAMAREHYHTSGINFPMQVSASELLHRYHKNIIMFTDEKPYLSNSPYLFSFNNVTSSVEAITPIQSQCTTGNKYKATNTLTGDRDNGWYRVNADRVVFSYISDKNYTSPDKYSYDFTVTNLRSLLYCPVNIFSADMWGYACNSSSCGIHPSDPRMARLLWSWQPGYPLGTGGTDIAVINHTSHHFTNRQLQSDHPYNVLCLKKPEPSLTAPTQGFSWYTLNTTLSPELIKDSSALSDYAQSLCSASGGFFAVPTTSYWMNDAVQSVPANNHDTLVNYQFAHGHWVANHGKSLLTPD